MVQNLGSPNHPVATKSARSMTVTAASTEASQVGWWTPVPVNLAKALTPVAAAVLTRAIAYGSRKVPRAREFYQEWRGELAAAGHASAHFSEDKIKSAFKELKATGHMKIRRGGVGQGKLVTLRSFSTDPNNHAVDILSGTMRGAVERVRQASRVQPGSHTGAALVYTPRATQVDKVDRTAVISLDDARRARQARAARTGAAVPLAQASTSTS